MDSIAIIIITFTQVLVGAVISILMTKRYLMTRYVPTLLLATFFWLVTVAFAIGLPLFWLPISAELLARFLYDASLVLLFVMFPFLIMALEGMNGRIYSPITAFAIGFTAYSLGFMTVIPPRWDYIFTNMWLQIDHIDFDILFSIFVLTMAGLVGYRLIQFVKEKETTRSKKYPMIAMVGFLGALIGGIGAYLLGILNIDYLSVLIGTGIVAGAYLIDPSSFFLSNTNIKTIMFIDNNRKIPYFTLGDTKLKNLDLAAAGLGGVMLMLQEILQSEQPPTRLIHANQGFLIEIHETYDVIAVIVVDQINDLLRQPLKYSLSLFIERYSEKLKDWHGEIDQFLDFEPELHQIFRFAMPD